MWPHGSIVIEETCRGDKRYHLEESRAESSFYSIAVTGNQQIGNPSGGNKYNGNVQFELRTFEQGTWFEFEDGYVKHHEIDAS